MLRACEGKDPARYPVDIGCPAGHWSWGKGCLPHPKPFFGTGACKPGIADKVKNEDIQHFKHHTWWQIGKRPVPTAGGVTHAPVGRSRERTLWVVWTLHREELKGRDSLGERGFSEGSREESCLQEKVFAHPEVRQKLSAHLADQTRSWPNQGPVPSKALVRKACEGEGFEGVDDLVNELKGDFEWRVGYHEVKGGIGKGRFMWHVIDVVWELFRRDFGAKLNQQGVTQGSEKERCLMSKMISTTQGRLTEHVRYWEAFDSAGFFGKIGLAIASGAKLVAAGFEAARKIFCATIGMPICMVIETVRTLGGFIVRLAKYKGNLGETLKSYWEDFKKKAAAAAKTAKEQLEGLFAEFKQFLTLKHEREFGDRAVKFAGRVFTTVRTVTTEFTSLVGLPDFLGEPLGLINGATTTAALSPAVIGLAAVNLGARKLFEWLLPELVLGVGSLAANAQTVAKPQGFDLFQAILDKLKEFAGPVAGGLIGILVKDEKKRERIRAVLEKVGDVAEKVEKGLGGVLALSRKIATGKFEEVEKALAEAGQKRVPEEFTPKQIAAMIDGLIDFAQDEVWGLLNPKLRDLLGKGMSLLDKLFDIPRGILVAAVGTIPFAGGVLSSALNFGLGLVVDIVKGFLIGEVMGLAEFILKDVMEGLKGAFKKRFFAESGPARPAPAEKLGEREERIRAAVRRSPSFAALVHSMGDSVDGVRRSLKTASLQQQGTVRALVATAMRDVLLRGVASAHVREMVTAAITSLAPRFTEPGFSLSRGIGAVLSNIERPLGQLLAGRVANPRIRRALLGGLAALVREAASEHGAARLGRSEEGVLGRLGADLVDRVRPEVVALLMGEHDNRMLEVIVVREVDALARFIRREGFSALLRMGELLRHAVSQATRPLAGLLVAELDEPAARRALARDMDGLISQVAAEVLAGPGAGTNLLTVIAEAASRRVVDRTGRANGGGRP